jgi:hypothetical protein
LIAEPAERSSAWTGEGARPHTDNTRLAPEFLLFGEDAGRIVISCDPTHLARIKEVAKKHGIFVDELGATVSGSLEIKIDGQVVVSGSVSDFNQSYEGALEKALRSDPAAVPAD